MTNKEKELVVLGCYIRCELDKQGFDGYLSAKDVSSHLAYKKTIISEGIVRPMKRFVEIFETLN